MSDRIFVRGLALHAYHGVMPHEAKVGQTFTLDLDLEIDLAPAARSDKVVDTVSYDKVVDCTAEAFGNERYRLIEAAAAASPMRCSPPSRACARCASRSTSRMRRSPRRSRMSA